MQIYKYHIYIYIILTMYIDMYNDMYESSRQQLSILLLQMIFSTPAIAVQCSMFISYASPGAVVFFVV